MKKTAILIILAFSSLFSFGQKSYERDSSFNWYSDTVKGNYVEIMPIQAIISDTIATTMNIIQIVPYDIGHTISIYFRIGNMFTKDVMFTDEETYIYYKSYGIKYLFWKISNIYNITIK